MHRYLEADLMAFILSHNWPTNLGHGTNFPCVTMVVNYIIIFIVKFPQCEQNDLYEWDKLPAYKPDVYQSHIGGRWQLLHHT